jgi:SAM-dependent methyltransferase
MAGKLRRIVEVGYGAEPILKKGLVLKPNEYYSGVELTAKEKLRLLEMKADETLGPLKKTDSKEFERMKKKLVGALNATSGLENSLRASVEEEIKRIQPHGGRISFTEGEIARLPFETSSADEIHFHNIFSDGRMSKEAAEKMVLEAKRVLKPSGYLVSSEDAAGAGEPPEKHHPLVLREHFEPVEENVLNAFKSRLASIRSLRVYAKK